MLFRSDNTEDQVLHDAVAAGAKIGAIFKEPTVTPTEVQKVALGLKKAWGSPNGAMRKGWNGITISRDTIRIEGVELGLDVVNTAAGAGRVGGAGAVVVLRSVLHRASSTRAICALGPAGRPDFPCGLHPIICAIVDQ